MGNNIGKCKKLKVDILTPIHFGGPQKWGNDLVRALNDEGVEVRNIHSFWGILKRFFWTDADIIHTTLPLFFNLQGKPIILTVKGNYKREKNLWNLFMPIAIRRSKRLTAHTKFIEKELDLKNPAIIPNGIFTERYNCERKTDKNSIRIVTVSGFSFWDKARGLIPLINTIENVSQDLSVKIEVVVIGGGKYLKALKDKIHTSNIGIQFLGFQEHPEDFLEKADLFAYYSYLDVFPIAILEAIASGLPVITNNYGPPAHEIFSESDGISVCNNEKEYEISLRKILENNDYRLNMSLKAKEASIKFDWRSLVKDYITVYRSL